MTPESKITPEMQELLDQLHTIVVPQPVSMWPPAVGWWILAALLLALLAYAILAVLRRRRYRLYRLEACAELDRLPDTPAPELAQQVSALLKRAALTAYPDDRNRIAGLYGTEWVRFLNHTCQQPAFSEISTRLLSGEVYRAAPTVDTRGLKQEAANWLKNHRKSLGPVALLPESNGGTVND